MQACRNILGYRRALTRWCVFGRESCAEPVSLPCTRDALLSSHGRLSWAVVTKIEASKAGYGETCVAER